ncbi:hypothetical protein P7C70_g4547, partial [Phenoliferia sp. Uapishka_3]
LPAPPSSSTAPPPPVGLTSDQFAEAMLQAFSGALPAHHPEDEEAGRRIADEITESWLGADEELRAELALIVSDPAFMPSSSSKYADAPTSAALSMEAGKDIPTGVFPLASDHARRLSFAFANSISRATRLSFLTPVPSSDPAARPKHDFSPALVLKQQQLLYRSIVKKGVEEHGGRILRYLAFCEEHAIAPKDIFPAQEDNVFMFLSTLGGLLRMPTIGAYANSIRFWHTLHGLDFSLSDERFRVLKQGLVQVQPGPQDARPPLYTLDLLVLREGLLRDVADPEHALQKPEADCIWAAATGAFHGMARSCDVTVAAQGLFDPQFDLAASAVKFYKASPDFAEHVTLALPFDKVKRRQGAVLYLVRQASDPRLDPVQAMAAHFQSNGLEAKEPQDGEPKPPEVFAFSYRATRNSKTLKKGVQRIVKVGDLITLTNSHFIKVVNAYLEAAGRGRVWGHSFRIGGATMYLLAGKHIDSIRVIGRWSSNAFDRYWRDIKMIAANHLADAEYVTAQSDAPVSISTLLSGTDPVAPQKKAARKKRS